MKAAHNVDMAKVSRKPGHQAPTHALELGLSPLPAIKSAMNTTLVPILGFKDHGHDKGDQKARPQDTLFPVRRLSISVFRTCVL